MKSIQKSWCISVLTKPGPASPRRDRQGQIRAAGDAEQQERHAADISQARNDGAAQPGNRPERLATAV